MHDLRRQEMLLMISVLPGIMPAQEFVRGNESPSHLVESAQRLGQPRYTVLNINNVVAWTRGDGQSNHTPKGRDGAIYPRGTASVVYQDGFVIGAKAYLDPQHTQPAGEQLVRVGGATYGAGTRSGWIEGFGVGAQQKDPDHPDVRVYRIRRDFAQLSAPEIDRDASEYFEISRSEVTESQRNAIRFQYDKDWNEWPVHLGAPYIERNGIPGYQPPPPLTDSFTPNDLISGNYDEPGMAGADHAFPADQAIWMVFNDANPDQALSFAGSLPMGVEIQRTIWGYRTPGSLEHMYFTRYRFINKGAGRLEYQTPAPLFLDSMHVGMFVDTDLGHFADDLVGCDTVLGIGYSYNGTDVDQAFQPFGIAPPAYGVQLLLGPWVQAAGSVGVRNFRKESGIRNQPMVTFGGWGSGDPYSHPPGGFSNYASGTGRWWKTLRGFAPLGVLGDPDQLYPIGPSQWSRYRYSGDPVAGTGHLDGSIGPYSVTPGSRQWWIATGPFSLAPADTQDVIVAAIGGLGADRFSSITMLKYHARFARQTADFLFQLPRPPAPPTVEVTELDQEVILNWGFDQASISQTEDPVIAESYRFEGYNVYQLPSNTASRDGGIRIATFDRRNAVTAIVDAIANPETGLIHPTVVQEGTDSGIQRHIRIHRDRIRDPSGSQPLRNGTSYTFGISAYSYSPVREAIPRSLESELTIVRAVPGSPVRAAPHSAFGDTLAIHQSAGITDVSVVATVVDPLKGTGHDYEVRFVESDGTPYWFVRNTTTNTDVLNPQPVVIAPDGNPIVEGGIQLFVQGVAPGLKGWTWDPAEGRFLTWVGGDFGLEGFFGAAGWNSPRNVFGDRVMIVRAHELKQVELRFAATTDIQGNFDPSDPNASYAYRYGRSFQNPPVRSEFAPFIVNAS
ncbi:MAG: hypothetical protein WD295_03845, partial [Bacteroidota bacterium]